MALELKFNKEEFDAISLAISIAIKFLDDDLRNEDTIKTLRDIEKQIGYFKYDK